MKRKLFVIVMPCIFLLTSCATEEANREQVANDLFDQLVKLSSSSATTRSNRPEPLIWADCIQYSGIVVPATFKPESDPFDELYVMPGHTFYGGLELISDSKPGDQDYNGGRWHLNVLKDGVDAAIYSEACSEEDLNPADFNATDMYFGCPLRPINN